MKKVTSEFERSVPSVRVLFESSYPGLELIEVFVGIQCEKYVRLTKILHFLSRFRSQFLELSCMFRKWVEVSCSVVHVVMFGKDQYCIHSF